MTNLARLLAAGTAIAALAAPAAAQYQQGYGYQQPYPQPYPQQQYQQGYGYNQYGYNQGYAQNPVGQIIDQLLGNRYNVTDRQAVSRCASAVIQQAQSQYGGYGNGYANNGYGNNAYHHGYRNLRVTSITDVQRRTRGLRVTGTLGPAYGGQYGNQYGYQNRGYGGDLSFRCNVDYSGAVTNIRINRGDRYRD